MARGAKMKQYPLIESFGLKTKRANCAASGIMIDVIEPADLEKLLSEGVNFYCTKLISPENDYVAQSWQYPKSQHPATHTFLGINIKPIEKPKPVSKEELLKTLKDPMFRDNTSKWNELISRIESQGVE
jgi:hypothetical protein